MPAKKLKILMIAFELPPYNSGGLGEAVLALTKSLAKMGIEITLLLPKKLPHKYDHIKIIYADELDTKKSLDEGEKTQTLIPSINYNKFNVYTKNLGPDLLGSGFIELSNLMVKRALNEEFDIIHGHDWMTVKACSELKKITGKKMILQVHATEYDRSPKQHIDPFKYTIEKLGMEESDAVIAVSKYTKHVINKYYQIPNEKIFVVYNAPTIENPNTENKLKIQENIILFVGRITYQKGMHQFLETCKKVIDEVPNTLVVITGNGDMYTEVINKSCEMGMAGHVIFTGFLRGAQRDIVFNSASVFLMPSVSEPFGLVAAEAAQFGIPVVISKQSGVSEVLEYGLKADFWDTKLMSKQIIKILTSKKHKLKISKGLEQDLKNLTWDNSAIDCNKVYNFVNE